MCFKKIRNYFQNNKKAVKTKEDKELVEINSKTVESLIVLAKENEMIVAKLKSLQETIRYLIASGDPKVMDYDKKIRNLLQDLRIALTKSDGQNSKKIDDILVDLDVAIADRKTRI